MKNKIFISLVIMMALSVTGITYVQVTWMRNALATSRENFNKAVFISLNNAAQQIETYQRMNSFSNYMFRSPFVAQDIDSSLSEFFSFDGFISNGDEGFRIKFSSSPDKKENDLPARDKRNKTEPDRKDSVLITASNVNKGGIRISQQGGIESPGGNSIMMSRSDFMQWVKQKTEEFNQMGDRLLNQIFESEKSFRPDPEMIRNVLNKIFPYFDINTPYEFAIIENGQPVAVSSKKISINEFLKSIYKVRLFSDDFFMPDIVLSIVFPERTNYLLGSISWMLGGSVILSLFIFSTFALSILFILRQKKISEVKSDFINNMTHEFKTPLATISLAADAITNPKVLNDEKSIRHFAGMIKKENDRMNKQVETILQIASLDKKEIEFKFEKVSVHKIISKAIDTVDIFVSQRQGKITTILAAENDMIYGDEEHLTNLVHNLLDNAVKYSPEKPEITVRTKSNNTGVELSVADRGIGMSKSVQSKIFERFYRQNTGNVHNVKGFGLGLNYVKAIVESHRGTIKVESEPGKGSCFSVFLPYKPEN